MLCTVFIYFLLFAVAPLWAKKMGSSTGRVGGGVHYPPSHGLSGNTNTYKSRHVYPHSTGLSGNSVAHRSGNYNSQPQVHHHYYYRPPQHISYGAYQHPVYQGTPPIYVYEYRNSGSRYDSLLTGLALYNLGRMSAGHSHDHYNRNNEYRSRSDETCKMRIEMNLVEYEETRIDCRLISSFILETARESNNVLTINTVNSTVTEKSSNGTIISNSTVVTSVQNTVVADALKVKGPSLQVTSRMQCFIIRMSRYTTDFKKKVECGLLQEYARESMRYNNSNQLITDLEIYVLIIYALMYLF